MYSFSYYVKKYSVACWACISSTHSYTVNEFRTNIGTLEGTSTLAAFALKWKTSCFLYQIDPKLSLSALKGTSGHLIFVHNNALSIEKGIPFP